MKSEQAATAMCSISHNKISQNNCNNLRCNNYNSRHADHLIGDFISSSRMMISSISTKKNFFLTYPHSFLIFHHHRRKKLENLKLILHTLRSFSINFFYFSLLKIYLTYLTAIAQNFIIATS